MLRAHENNFIIIHPDLFWQPDLFCHDTGLRTSTLAYAAPLSLAPGTKGITGPLLTLEHRTPDRSLVPRHSTAHLGKQLVRAPRGRLQLRRLGRVDALAQTADVVRRRLDAAAEPGERLALLQRRHLRVDGRREVGERRTRHHRVAIGRRRLTFVGRAVQQLVGRRTLQQVRTHATFTVPRPSFLSTRSIKPDSYSYFFTYFTFTQTVFHFPSGKKQWTDTFT
jgi:hypothetical protein